MPLLTRRNFVIATGALAVLPPSLASAGSHNVEMLNKHPTDPKGRMVFHPRVITVNAGDSVTFVPSDKSHNSLSIKGMVPEGGETWKGKINQEVTVTLTKAGYYGYLCQPHQAMGMVGLIIVEGEGNNANLESAKAIKHRGRSQKVFDEIWAQAETEGLLA
ncbi:MAG: pseudoazurin [Pseudomonadota bacterium]